MKKAFFLLCFFLCNSIFAEGEPRPPTSRCNGYTRLFLTGDFIYWKARQEELNSIANFSFVQEGVERDIRVKAKDIDFKFSPGFKLGLGGSLPYDGWDLYLNWTHLHNNPVTTYKSASHDLVNIERLQGGAPFVTNDATVRFNLMLNVLDFDWGRRWSLSDAWSIRPSFGAKALWIHQKIGYKFENVQTIPIPNLGPIPGFPEFIDATNNYWGIGPYFAFEGKWSFGWGIGILGKISGSIVWGEFKQKGRSDESELEFSGGNPTVSLTHVHQEADAYRVRPTAQMFIGIDWERCLIPDRFSLQLRVGYETQYYWGQLLNVRDIEESDLSLEGLTAMARIDF